MNSLQSGSGDVSQNVRDVAETLLEQFPQDVALLTGISLPASGSERAALLDLVILTATAVVVGIDGQRQTAASMPPRQAGQRLLRLQQEEELDPALPVYVFWLGDPPADAAGDVPALPDADRIQRYVLRASAQEAMPRPQTAATLADCLLRTDGERQARGPHTPPLRRVLKAIADPGLLEHIMPIRLGAGDRPLLPADVNRHLREAMLDKQNWLEDVNYGKIVPNVFVVEVGEDNYRRNYAPIAPQVLQQWRDRLLTALNVANSRHGRRTYRFGGSVRLEIRPAADLGQHEVRVRSRIEPDAEAAPAPAAPCLEAVDGRRRWPLREDLIVIGRSSKSDIYLDDPQVQEHRLVSSRHAHLRRKAGRYLLYDGSPDGKASLNGTYVNDREVHDQGYELQDGDLIVLAAVNPAHPRPDTPGVAALRFRRKC
ncbi:MAG TPA: FHA domain-containing protein [Candidatus Sulfomarinibacteraceae bacterium]|nr:FHA domain-containing protein [Candidatus Sulfomarinibacteraceae bacterium]